MTEIAIEFNDQQVQRALDELINRVEDPRLAMRAIAGVLEDASEEAFRSESDPATGIAWAPLSPDTTLARRPDREGGSILQDSGLLAVSIVSDYGPDYAEVGSNRPYAPTHQFGAQQGEFGTTSRGGPIPWGDIPARPFLGIGPEDEQEILDIASRFLAGAFTDE
ncbi:MAG: phage virion morphogenesis protein [Alteromonadaceae bacterium]|nr:phage virion morphogenesis protein [Alteromonadaceae bacterium]